MARGKAKAGGRTKTGGKTQPTVRDARAEVLKEANLILLVMLGYLLLSGFSRLAPIVSVPFAVGLVVGVLSNHQGSAMRVAAVGSGLGALLAGYAYRIDTVVEALNAMPAWANPDIPGSFYTAFLLPLIGEHPVNDSLGGATGLILLVVFGAIISGGVAVGVVVFKSRLSNRDARRSFSRVVAWVAVGLVVVSFLTTALHATEDFRRSVSVEPADGAYAYDPYIYLMCSIL